jgi:rubredoxin
VNIEDMTPEQLGQIEAALTFAIKGKLVMTAPCPKCGMAKRLHEKFIAEGAVRHECRSCGYLMVWKAREPDTPERRAAWREEAYKQTSGRAYANR